jgi:hypothetical protein
MELLLEYGGKARLELGPFHPWNGPPTPFSLCIGKPCWKSEEFDLEADICRSQSSIASFWEESLYIDKAVSGGKMAEAGRDMMVQSRQVPQWLGLRHEAYADEEGKDERLW